MDVTNPTAATAAATTAPPQRQEPAINSDFETFLVMLTAQMENQDPLNPLDSQDFATQLATFSGVEQQVKTNDLLSALTAQIMTSGLAEMSGWVGMQARVSAPAAFSGDPVEIVPSPPAFADRADLVVRNAAGEVVQRAAIPVSNDPFFWDGKDTNGVPFASDTYSFSIEAFSNGDVIDTHTPDIYAQVTEVRTVDGSNVVVLEGGEILPATSVSGLR